MKRKAYIALALALSLALLPACSKKEEKKDRESHECRMGT